MGLFDSISDVLGSTNLIGGATSLLTDSLGNSSTTSTSIAEPTAEEQALRDQISSLFLTTDESGNSIPGVYNASDAMSNYMSLADEWQSFADNYTQQYNDIADQYSQNVSSIPGLSVTLPTSLGGASVSLTPGAWQDYYSNQASTLSGLTDSARTTDATSLSSQASIDQYPLTLLQNYLGSLQGDRTGQTTTTTSSDADLMQIAAALAMFGM